MTSKSLITKDGTRGTLSYDLDFFDSEVSFTDSDSNKYTLDTADNLFKNGSEILSDQISVKQAFGQEINSSIPSAADRKKYLDMAKGLNIWENPGGASAGDTGDGGTPQQVVNKPAPRPPKVHRNYGNLRYPLELFDTDYMMIRQFKYVPLSEFDQVSSQRERRADRRHKNSIGSVTLPIPSQLTDSNGVSWNQSELNDLQMRGLTAASGLMNSGAPIAEVQRIVNEGLTDLQKNTGEAKQFIQSVLLGGLPGINKNPSEILGRLQGQIINPNLELIFGGPTLRQFQYSFRLTPRNNRETLVVRSIIRFFKQGMSVKENPTNFFLSAPNVFQPRFYNKDGQQHTFINTIKKCACTSFTVNYVPDNTFMTLPNSSMTAYEISMGFQELDPIIDQDYAELDNNQDDVIGF